MFLTKWQRKRWNQKIPASVDIDDFIGFELWKIKLILEAQSKQWQGEKAQLSLSFILSNASGCPLQISLGETALAAVAWSDFTVHSSSIPRGWHVEISFMPRRDEQTHWWALATDSTSVTWEQLDMHNLQPHPSLLNQNLPYNKYMVSMWGCKLCPSATQLSYSSSQSLISQLFGELLFKNYSLN